MCTVILPPGDNPIAVNKYIISYILFVTEVHATDDDREKLQKMQFTA